MFYDYVELEDGTQIAFSNVLEDNTVEVSVERPVELDFDSALCRLPSYSWSGVKGFSPAEMERLDAFVRSNAPLILKLAQETSRAYA